MNNKLSRVVFAQGWLDGQIESMIANTAKKQNEDPTAHLIVSQIQEQWSIVSSALDDLIKENTDLARRMVIIKSALQ